MSNENEKIADIANNNSLDLDIEEEEIKPIPELLDEEELIIEDCNNNNKQNENQYKNDDNILLKENSIEDNKIDYFPINDIIPNEEIDNIDINIDNSIKINNNSNNIINNSKGKIINKFSFLTHIANKIKDKISKNSYITNNNDKDNVKNKDKSKDFIFNNDDNDDVNVNSSIENKSFGEEEEEDELFEEMDEHFSYFEEKNKNKNKDNNNMYRKIPVPAIEKNKKEKKIFFDNDNNSLYKYNSFYSLSSSLNEDIENTIAEIIETDNNDKQSSFMKQMLVETNKHYIKEKIQQIEKIQEWGLKVIFNILLSNKNRIVQNAFYMIKYNRMSLMKNKEKNLINFYKKYRTKVQNEFIKKYFTKFKIRTIELKPREERIYDLIKGLNIDTKNIEIVKKIERLINDKTLCFNKKKEEGDINKKNKDKDSYYKLENNKIKNINKNKEEQTNNINQNKDKDKKEEKKLINIDNNISETETTSNSLIPPPPPPPLFPGMPLSSMGSGVPIPPPIFVINAIPDPTKNIPKIPKGYVSRKFQWQKVEYVNYKKSFWKEIEEEQEKSKNPFKIDYDSLQKKFTYEKISKKTETKNENEKQRKKEEKISILDSKHLMNISICLSKIKLSKDKLESLIKVYDMNNLLDVDTIQSILCFFPKDEEQKALLNYNDDIEKLTYPDQFCKMLVSIENCQKILKLLLFKKQLSGKVSNMILQLKILKDAVLSINNSEQFKSVLFILRQIGNYLNAGTSVGKAFGFSINSLSKLDSIKGINKERTSLLEEFIMIIKKDNPGLINFYKDFKKLEESKNCTKDEIDKNIIDLKLMINQIIKEKETKTKNEEYLEFINDMETYTKSKMDCLELTEQCLNDEIDKTIIIYGENQSKFNINNFIKNIIAFVDKYKACCLEISKRESKILKKKIIEVKKKKEIPIINIEIQKICENTKKCFTKRGYLKIDIDKDRERVRKIKTQRNGSLKIFTQKRESQLIKIKNSEINKDKTMEVNKKNIINKEKNKMIKKTDIENDKGDKGDNNTYKIKKKKY